MNELHHLTPAQIRARKLSFLALIIMVLGSLGIDQITKIKAEQELMVWEDQTNLKQYQGKRYPVWSMGQWTPSNQEPQWFFSFNFNYVRNQGAAWGFLSDLDDTYRIPFFYLVTFIAVFVILLYIRATPLSHRLARFTLLLILSGALGNFTDRILRGYVIDFLDVRWVIPLPFEINLKWNYFTGPLSFLNADTHMNAFRYNFPNFNWADSTITVGVCLLLIDMIFLEKIRLNKAEKALS